MFRFLTEAKTRSRWKREVEQQAGKGSWKGEQRTKFGPNVSWHTKVRQISYDLRLSTAVKKHVLQTFEHLEKTNGAGYVDKLTDSQLYYAVKLAANKYSSYERVVPAALRKPGVSHVYRLPPTLTVRTGLEHPDPESKGAKYAAASRTGRGSGDQLRANIADVELHKLTRKDLEKHTHPDVKRLYKAVDPLTSKFQRDGAVVWNSEGTPFYMFAKLMKVRESGPEQKGKGPKTYDFIIPRSMNFKNKSVPIRHLGKYKKEGSLDLVGEYTKNSPWRSLYKSEELMKLNVEPGGATVRPVKSSDLGTIAVYAQKVAYFKAKPFIVMKKKLLQTRAILDKFEEIEKRMGELEAPQEEQRKAVFTGHHEAEQSMKKLGTNYTWYLYLLALEDEHGVRIAERQKEHKLWPKVPSKIKGHTRHWTIQYEGSEDTPRWEKTILAKAGYPTHNLGRFYEDLSKSVYKLGAQSQRALNHLWIPVTGPYEKFGLHSHKENIDDYLEKAKIKPAMFIFGWEGGEIEVKEKFPHPLSEFTAGNPRRSFALIPAMEYLKWFDSPKHSGRRFVHGKKTLAPAKRYLDPDDPFRDKRKVAKTKMQKRAQSYRVSRVTRRHEQPQLYPDIYSKKFRYDLDKIRKERIQASADYIKRAMDKQQQKARRQVSFSTRKTERIKQAERRHAVVGLHLGAKERESVTRALAFRQRISHQTHDKPGIGLIVDKSKPWVSPSNKLARFTPLPTVIRRGRPVGVARSRVPTKVTIDPVKQQRPLPTWKDYLSGSATWATYWRRKNPKQKKFLLQDTTVNQLKAQFRQDYREKIKAYVRQAHEEGFIVIDSRGQEVTLSNLHISDRDLR